LYFCIVVIVGWFAGADNPHKCKEVIGNLRVLASRDCSGGAGQHYAAKKEGLGLLVRFIDYMGHLV
jgi:hypothetical protein